MRETSWEFEGRSVEDALETALEELNLEREDVHVEVLEEQQKGFLGLGGKSARIRVEMIGEWEVLGKAKESERPAGRPQEEEKMPESKEDEEVEDEYVPTEIATRPRKMVQEILRIMEIDALVEAREKEEQVLVDVWGEDVAILIGKGGATLESLQYLVNISCRRTGEVDKRIIIDIEGYRKRRKARLEKQAEQLATKAKSQGKSVEMPPMSPSERKIVHMALRSIPGVRSESSGEEPERRVVIYPEK